jgi:SAM-dependent methyltransferase
VPHLLECAGASSAFVVGVGSGRQYAFLERLGITLSGIDVSPTLVAECRRRYPAIETTCDALLGMEHRHKPADAVLSSAVLQHVPPPGLSSALSSVKAMAERIVVIRELTWMAKAADYVWAHDYGEAFSDWVLVHDQQTDRTERYEVRLRAWTRDAEITSGGEIARSEHGDKHYPSESCANIRSDDRMRPDPPFRAHDRNRRSP